MKQESYKVVAAVADNAPNYWLIYRGKFTWKGEPIAQCAKEDDAHLIVTALNTAPGRVFVESEKEYLIRLLKAASASLDTYCKQVNGNLNDSLAIEIDNAVAKSEHNEKNTTILTMYSDEYGSEEFEYNTEEEALAGKRRIEKKIHKLNDGIVRTFSITKLNYKAATDPANRP